MKRPACLLAAIFAHLSVSSGFVAGSLPQKSCRTKLRAVQEGRGSSDDGQRKQERYLEAMSLRGADEIAKMDITERTTRALLAEAVEDRIFQLQDDLEQLSGGAVPTDDSVKAQCIEIAKDIRRSQLQYSDLVSGAPSELLDSMKSWEKAQDAADIVEDIDADQNAFE